MLFATSLAVAVGRDALAPELVLVLDVAGNTELAGAEAEPPAVPPRLVGKEVIGPAANFEFNTTATPIEPSADKSSSGTMSRFALRDILISAGVGLAA